MSYLFVAIMYIIFCVMMQAYSLITGVWNECACVWDFAREGANALAGKLQGWATKVLMNIINGG